MNTANKTIDQERLDRAKALGFRLAVNALDVKINNLPEQHQEMVLCISDALWRIYADMPGHGGEPHAET